MRREYYNLISSVLFSAIKEGEAEPRLALRFAAALRVEDPKFPTQDFVNRCVSPKQRAELGKISVRPPPPKTKKEPMLIEDNAALFKAILSVEFPQLSERVSCVLIPKLPSRFTVGRAGGQVWIRFGSQALADPIAAVKAAAPEAETMVFGQTAAKQIIGR